MSLEIHLKNCTFSEWERKSVVKVRAHRTFPRNSSLFEKKISDKNHLLRFEWEPRMYVICAFSLRVRMKKRRGEWDNSGEMQERAAAWARFPPKLTFIKTRLHLSRTWSPIDDDGIQIYPHTQRTAIHFLVVAARSLEAEAAMLLTCLLDGVQAWLPRARSFGRKAALPLSNEDATRFKWRKCRNQFHFRRNRTKLYDTLEHESLCNLQQKPLTVKNDSGSSQNRFWSQIVSAFKAFIKSTIFDQFECNNTKAGKQLAGKYNIRVGWTTDKQIEQYWNCHWKHAYLIPGSSIT